jgi:hypothetical protein
MTDKSKWQKEFDALPPWAQRMVRGVTGMGCHGFGHEEEILAGMSTESKKKYRGFFAGLRADAMEDWREGFWELCDLAQALTAPWPPPTDLPPHEKMTTQNIVEMIQSPDDDCAFDQQCYFGHRVNGHAIYCHNDAWPDAPRKCRRNRTDHLHEDCPGYVPNSVLTPTKCEGD